MISNYFEQRKPSAVRLANIEFAKREDDVTAINTAIGNVTLPMHPAMQKRLFNLDAEGSPFKGGVVEYAPTPGFKETQQAFFNILKANGYKTDNLHCHITDGGSVGMELVILGTCDPDTPLMLIDPAYTNYNALCDRTGRKTISVTRKLGEDGEFVLPSFEEIEATIIQNKPGALVIIPYDNPTGHFYDHDIIVKLAKLCVKHNLFIVSDEAYRELYYLDHPTSSIWAVTEEEVPGITGKRISIETASKVWNACGLRVGAIISENKHYIEQSVAEYTGNLCPNAVGGYIFGALAHESREDLFEWYRKQRDYYKNMITNVSQELKALMPELIISAPQSSIYSIVDVRNIAPNFDSKDFVLYCAQRGKVEIEGEYYTLLVAPMAGFYSNKENNPGKTQMRVAFVESADKMKLVPKLFATLFKEYMTTQL